MARAATVAVSADGATVAAPSLRARAPRFGIGGARSTSQFTDFDESLVWVGVLLLLIGLVMVYSSSIAFAEGSRFTEIGRAHV